MRNAWQWARRAGLALGIAAGAMAATPPASPPAASIVIGDFRFQPASLTVAAGATVVWTNRDDDPHTVTSADDPSRFASPPLDTGQTFAFRFEEPGTYHYFCSVHPHMQGTVIVLARAP